MNVMTAGEESVEIRSVDAQIGPSHVNGGRKNGSSGPVPEGSPAQDSVQISPTAKALDLYKKMPEVRADKVVEARRMIEAGELDTEHKLSVAMDRMLEDLLSD
jgi:hypothetical protein